MTWNEILAAIVTSLIASVVFWLVFNVIPNAVERRKIKPLLDFDLYQIYSRLAFFLEVPLRHSTHSPSFLQHRLYNGELKKEDFGLYLATKCLTEEYQKVDEMAKNLMPIGHDLKERASEILEMIQKLYVFNKYLTAEQILLCRKIADKITMYDFEMQAFVYEGKFVLGPVNPTMSGMESMFYDTYGLFLQLQDLLVKQKPMGNDLGNFYKDLLFRKVGLMYSQGEYRKVAKMTRGKNDSNTVAYHFRSLYRSGDKEKGLEALRRFLKADSLQLISLRSHFEEFLDDAAIREVLVDERSEEECQEMIDCLDKEKEQQAVFEKFAVEMREFYARKVSGVTGRVNNV